MPTEVPAAPRLRFAPEDIVNAVRHLPSAPKVLPRLKRLLLDGNSALERIVGLIRLDPGLAARVLRVSNSTYFYTGARCATVEEAVARVGYDEIYALVAHAVAAQVLNRPVAVYRIEGDEMWARSVCCAIAAEALAARVGVDPNAAYTLGLLHGIGMIVLDEWALLSGHDVKLAIYPFPAEATRSERTQLGFTHADVGACLLKTWEFPEEITSPIRHQYSPTTAPSWQALAALLVAARWLRSAVLSSIPGTLPPLPSATQIRPAGIAVSMLTDSLSPVAREFAAATTMLEEVVETTVDREAFPSHRWRS